jgi:hypothetical protein
MKRVAIVLAVLGGLLLLAGTGEAEPNGRNVCFRDCSSCKTRCRTAADLSMCSRTCLEIKRLCCRSCGSQLGPQLTCNCG